MAQETAGVKQLAMLLVREQLAATRMKGPKCFNLRPDHAEPKSREQKTICKGAIILIIAALIESVQIPESEGETFESARSYSLAANYLWSAI